MRSLSLPPDSATRSAFILSAGSIASIAISFGSAPLITRAYGPELIGRLGVLVAIVSVLTLVSTGAFHLAIPLPAKETTARALHRLSSRCAWGLSLALLCGLYWREDAADLLDQPGMSAWLFFVPILVLLGGLSQAKISLATRIRTYVPIAAGRVGQSFITAFIQVGGSTLGWIALPLGLVAGLATNLIVIRAPLSPAPAARGEDGESLRGIAHEYRRFPLYTMPAGLLDTFTIQLPVILGTWFFGTTFAGFYTMATRILFAPSTAVGSAIGQVFYREFAAELENTAAARKRLFLTWARLGALGAVPFALVAYLGPSLFAFAFGETWREAGIMAAILSPMCFAMFVSSPTSGAMLALRGQRVAAVFSVSFLIYRAGSFWLGERAGDPFLGLGALAAAEIFTIIVYNILLLRRLGRHSTHGLLAK